MSADVEAVRVALGLGQIDLLGHSFGGILAQDVAIRYPASIRRLILASTGSSAARINADFSDDQGIARQGSACADRGAGGAGHHRPGRRAASGVPPAGGQGGSALQLLRAATGLETESGGSLGWDVLNEMWGAKSDFHIDGNLMGFDFTPEPAHAADSDAW